ncbi:hypothetical protein ACP4OV_001965 [Aristida adscensionis]
MLLVAYCAEAQKICEDPNHNFNGPCISNKNCALDCYNQNHNYIGGHCPGPGEPSPPGEEPSPPGEVPSPPGEGPSPPGTVLLVPTIPGRKMSN